MSSKQRRALPLDSRRLAVEVLVRVEKDAAFAAAALDSTLSAHPGLESRDRGLLTELVYGVLRTRGSLLASLEPFATQGLKKTDRLVRLHLLVGAYQIRFLDRVPGFAVVDTAVESVSRVRGKRMGSFVNAVLRKLWESELNRDLPAARLESAPGWLLTELTKSVGEPAAHALLGADPGTPYLGGASGRLQPSATAENVDRRIYSAEAGRINSMARRMERLGDLRTYTGYAEGRFVVQEEGAQVIALALGAQPGEKVLDACAGRGQKSSLLASQVGPEGSVWACDLYPAKLEALQEEFTRLQLPAAETVAVDWTQGVATTPSDFDRVLVDAPCTGTGTLRRRPEIAHRLKAEDPARIAKLSEDILRGAAARAKPAGRVVFAVCSVLTAECEDVVKKVKKLLEPVPFDVPELAELAEGACSLRLHPLSHGTDGYFVASFRRRAP